MKPTRRAAPPPDKEPHKRRGGVALIVAQRDLTRAAFVSHGVVTQEIAAKDSGVSLTTCAKVGGCKHSMNDCVQGGNKHLSPICDCHQRATYTGNQSCSGKWKSQFLGESRIYRCEAGAGVN